MKSKYFVFDTNSLLSASLLRHSKNKKTLIRAIELGTIAISIKSLIEIVEVLFRRKFDSYFWDENERWSIINELEVNSELFNPTISIQACRDTKDNKFLELAITCGAPCIVTGDKDLLVLHPFRGIPIMTASDFLEKF